MIRGVLRRQRVLTVLVLGGLGLGFGACHLSDLVESKEPESSSDDPAPPDTSDNEPSPQATRLVFDVNPGDVVAGDIISPPVSIAVHDETGELVSDFSGTVTISIANGPDGAALSGEVSREAVDGVATFEDLLIERAAADYTLAAAAEALEGATSDPFGVTPAVPNALEAIDGDAQVDTVAATLVEPYVISVTDAFGNPVPDVGVVWTVVKGEGSVAPANNETDGQGQASATHTFGTLAGDQVVVAVAAGLPEATKTFVSHANPGQPASIDILQQPTNTRSGAIIAPPIVARIIDQFGNAATQLTEPVAIRLAPLTGTPLAQLSGTLSRVPASGTVTFDDLSIDLAGLNYRLRLTTEGLSRDSRAFSVF